MCKGLIPDVGFSVLWQRFRFGFMLNEYFIQVKFSHPKLGVHQLGRIW